MDNIGTHINRHYAPADLSERILEGLRKAGKDPQRFSYDDLNAVDQFHTRGKQATIDLARRAAVQAGMRVLDVGGGLGGAARTLAAEFGCEVTVLDMTAEYCRVGALLTQRAGLAENVTFRVGDAREMPFADASFDLVWCQHCTMNIADKAQLLAEAYRVLRVGGRLVLHEIMAGANQPIHFPVPWAAEPSLSFLQRPRDFAALLARQKFEKIAFDDTSLAALDWYRTRLASAPAEPPPLGVHLLLGGNFVPAFQNLVRNAEEDRIAVIEAVCRKGVARD